MFKHIGNRNGQSVVRFHTVYTVEGDETDFLTLNTFQHRLHIELDFQILFGLHVHSCSH